MYKVHIMNEYVYEHFETMRKCIEYTTDLADALGYKMIAKLYEQYVEFNFYNNFLHQNSEVIDEQRDNNQS